MEPLNTSRFQLTQKSMTLLPSTTMSLIPESILLFKGFETNTIGMAFTMTSENFKLFIRNNFSRIHFFKLVFVIRSKPATLARLQPLCHLSLSAQSSQSPLQKNHGIIWVSSKCNDHFGIIAFGCQHILVIVCYLSKFVIARPLKTKTSREILDCLQDIYLSFG